MAKSPESFMFTVGKLDAGMAILLGERAHLIEFPSLLLPPGVTTGSIVNISVQQNHSEEKKRDAEFWGLQNDILQTYGTKTPEHPKLEVRSLSVMTCYGSIRVRSCVMSHKPPLPSNGLLYNWQLRSYVHSTSTATANVSQQYPLQRPILPPSCRDCNSTPSTPSNSSYVQLQAPTRRTCCTYAHTP
ncbi:hypothetical protein NM688_g8678 [Phlebia brevispora]|uniref:Uncharacterized protein n=1 Tax=Phlebia brevispora TaxID=194682 RepID=A0ACC1RP07_9APHY|nr:hypothetical protein NM688_g8678 [Phlebia brevispora]